MDARRPAVADLQRLVLSVCRVNMTANQNMEERCSPRVTTRNMNVLLSPFDISIEFSLWPVTANMYELNSANAVKDSLPEPRGSWSNMLASNLPCHLDVFKTEAQSSLLFRMIFFKG